MAKPVGWRDLRPGDFVQLSGYWHRITNIEVVPDRGSTVREFTLERPVGAVAAGITHSQCWHATSFRRPRG